MYCKLFASLYQGTLRGRAHEILVFTNLLAHADKDGYVDKHFKAIADEVGLTREEVEAAVENLEAPDSESRSKELNGARLERIDDHRSWGWRIVNYVKYRSIKDADDRRAQNREAQSRHRTMSKQMSAHVSSSKLKSAHTEVEVEVEVSNNGDLQSPIVEPDAQWDECTTDPPKEKTCQPTSNPKTEDDIILAIYNAYPRKVAKPEALKAIAKAIKKIDPVILLARTKSYALLRGQNNEFTPHPATWFNQERFNDDPSTWSTKTDRPPIENQI